MRKRKGNKVATKSSSPEPQQEGYSQTLTERARKRRHDLPWQMMRVACLTAATSWALLMAATGLEILLGHESLLKPPGEPPWIRDTKFREWTPASMHSSVSSSLPGDYRLFSASTAFYEDDEAHGTGDDDASHGAEHGTHRRLTSANRTAKAAVLSELLKTLPLLEELAGRVSDEGVYLASGDRRPELPLPAAGFMSVSQKSLDVAWPPLFEPKHVLCGYQAGSPEKVVTLTRRGFGALVPVSSAGGRSESQPFSLEGVGESGPLAGATWTRRGLQLVTSKGKLLHCPGHAPVDGIWSCGMDRHAPFPLPAGAELLAAAFKEAADDANDASSDPLLALVFKNLPRLVMLYSSKDGTWRPSGEVHLPADDHRVGLNFHGDDLLISTSLGDVRRHSLKGTSSTVLVSPAVDAGRLFSSACPTSEEGLVRLAFRQRSSDAGAARSPELLFSE